MNSPGGRGRRRALAALFLGFSCLLAGCRSEPRAAREPASGTPVRGDRVVVELEAAEFFEARVTDVSERELRVEDVSSKQTHAVSRADVYVLAADAAARELAAKSHAICRVAPARWRGCRIESLAAGRVIASDASGKSLDLAREDVIEPTQVTLLNLRHAFETAARRSSFQRAVTQAGQPRAPAGWRPSPRERVLAELSGLWYPARIHEIDDDRIHVAWRSDGRITELGKHQVVPEPPYQHPLAPGAIVLMRPSSETAAWPAMRVVKAAGSEIVVEDAEGERASVAPADVVPLRR